MRRIRGGAARGRGLITVLALALVTSVSGCAGDDAGDTASGYPKTFSNCGHDVRLTKPVRRVFAERDTSTAVVAAGAGDRLVARSGEGDVPLGRYADQLRRVRQVTPSSSEPPSPEVVVGTRADLVVAGHVTRQDVQALEAVGVPVLVPDYFCQQVYGDKDPVGFDDTYRTLRLMGRVFGTQQQAARAESDLRGRVAAVQRRFAGEQRRSAANLYVGESDLRAYGGPSVNDAVLATLGLRNSYADSQQRNGSISTESLAARDPDLLVLSYGTAYGISTGPAALRTLTGLGGLDDLTAVRRRQVLSINYGYLTGGPLTVDGLEMLADQLRAGRSASGD